MSEISQPPSLRTLGRGNSCAPLRWRCRLTPEAPALGSRTDVIHTPPCQAAVSVPLALRVKLACELIGIGRSQLYELVTEGDIATIKVASATLISIASLAPFVESRRNAS